MLFSWLTVIDISVFFSGFSGSWCKFNTSNKRSASILDKKRMGSSPKSFHKLLALPWNPNSQMVATRSTAEASRLWWNLRKNGAGRSIKHCCGRSPRSSQWISVSSSGQYCYRWRYFVLCHHLRHLSWLNADQTEVPTFSYCSFVNAAEHVTRLYVSYEILAIVFLSPDNNFIAPGLRAFIFRLANTWKGLSYAAYLVRVCFKSNDRKFFWWTEFCFDRIPICSFWSSDG